MTGPVISVSGVPGAGKTTLGRWLTAHLGATRVNYDEFEQMTRKSPDEIADWLDRGAPIDEIPAPGLAEAVVAARAMGVTIYETHLGRAWSPTRDLIDISVWVETPLDLALARRLHTIARNYEMRGGPVEPCARWFQGHLDAYQKIVRPSLTVQAQRVRGLADVTVNNDGTIESTKAQLLKALSELGISA